MKSVTTFVSGFLTASVIGISTYGAVAYAHDKQDQLECLAMNIYHESRGEEVLGQIAVGQVTMNRVEHEWFPDSVCEVVWQNKQFSWTHDGLADAPTDSKAWSRAKSIAETVYAGEEDDPTEGSLFYHAEWVNPSWTKKMDFHSQIGVHKFYQWDGNWNND